MHLIFLKPSKLLNNFLQNNITIIRKITSYAIESKQLNHSMRHEHNRIKQKYSKRAQEKNNTKQSHLRCIPCIPWRTHRISHGISHGPQYMCWYFCRAGTLSPTMRSNSLSGQTFPDFVGNYHGGRPRAPHGHEPWTMSLEPWAMSLEPWAMNN